MIETIFVTRGAEADAVRRAAARARSNVRVVESGIGPVAAAYAAEEALRAAPVGRVLVAGLCGLLSPSFEVGEVLVYRSIARDGAPTLDLNRDLATGVASKLARVQTGIRGFTSERVVTSAVDKRELGLRAHADAVDMESHAVVTCIRAHGYGVAVVRVASDGMGDSLPDLERALDGAGGMDGLALALAMLRRPRAGLRLARDGSKALASLRDAVETILR